ncbi:D-inositol 3-phosphate glycosyltransferase [compost metagenome]
MDECFHLFGPTLDIKYVYDRIDVLLFPSHFDAPGRPVFEAGFSSVPSIVAVENPSADTFVPNHTGLAIKARDANALAEAIAYFNDNPEERKRMGDNARQLALQNFTPETNAKKLLDIYSDLVVSR